MISFHTSTDDPFSLYGIDHFFSRFGIPFRKNPPDPAEISVWYGAGAHGPFTVTVPEHPTRADPTGTVFYGDHSALVFETPDDTGTAGECMAVFDGGSGKYPCATLGKDSAGIGIDLFSETGYFLSGHPDKTWPLLDEEKKSVVAKNPAIDLLETLLYDLLIKGCCSRKIPLIHHTRWPEGKPYAVCLTHDVDEVKKTYQWLTRPARSVMHGDVRALMGQVRSLARKMQGSKPYFTFPDIFALEDEYQAKSTYFFLEERGCPSLLSPKSWSFCGRTHDFLDAAVQEALALVQAHGDEIGIHGSYHSFGEQALLEYETQKLEEVAGRKVTGTRQHHLNLLIPVTWKYQRSAGLKYDCSLGFRDRTGFRWGTSYPFHPFDGKTTLPIREIPLGIMDICLYSCRDPLKECTTLADTAGRFGGVLTLLWHPPLCNALEFPDGAAWYRQLLDYCHAGGAWITCAEDISRWQEDRDASSFSWTRDGPYYTLIPGRKDQPCHITFEIPAGAEFRLCSGTAVITGRVKDATIPGTESVHLRIPEAGAGTRVTVKTA